MFFFFGGGGTDQTSTLRPPPPSTATATSFSSLVAAALVLTSAWDSQCGALGLACGFWLVLVWRFGVVQYLWFGFQLGSFLIGVG